MVIPLSIQIYIGHTPWVVYEDGPQVCKTEAKTSSIEQVMLFGARVCTEVIRKELQYGVPTNTPVLLDQGSIISNC